MINLRTIHIHRGSAAIEFFHFHHVGGVVLRQQTCRIGLDAQIRVLRDQDDLFFPGLQQRLGAGQNVVVRVMLVETGNAKVQRVHGHIHLHGAAAIHFYAHAQAALLPQVVQLSRYSARVAADFGLVLLEMIYLLDYHDGDHHIVFLEMENCVGVVQQNVGVENEDFLAGCGQPCLQFFWGAYH